MPVLLLINLGLLTNNRTFGTFNWSVRLRIVLLIRGLFGKFVEFGHKMFKYLYNPFIFLNITDGH